MFTAAGSQSQAGRLWSCLFQALQPDLVTSSSLDSQDDAEQGLNWPSLAPPYPTAFPSVLLAQFRS